MTMRKRIYIKINCGDDIRNDVFKYDYTGALNRCMTVDADGFWLSCGREIVLERTVPCREFYKKAWVEVEPATVAADCRDDDAVMFREWVNAAGLEVVVVHCRDAGRCPAVVICLGGPATPVPDFLAAGTIYRYFLSRGFALIIPLRRGVQGMGPEWECALDGHYGEYDVADTVEAADYALTRHYDLIDAANVFLYGGSYGGYVAELIAGKANADRRFKAVVAHCGVYDLTTYPWHCQGIAEETMTTYGRTIDAAEYAQNVSGISPKTYVGELSVPLLLVHHLNDTSTWVGQSVEAYNDALRLKKDVSLLIVEGPHTYDIPQKETLFRKISAFFEKNTHR